MHYGIYTLWTKSMDEEAGKAGKESKKTKRGEETGRTRKNTRNLEDDLKRELVGELKNVQ